MGGECLATTEKGVIARIPQSVGAGLVPAHFVPAYKAEINSATTLFHQVAEILDKTSP